MTTPYVHQDYPAARYHRDLPPVQVADAAADAALGPGWYDTPAVFCPHANAQPEHEHCPDCALHRERWDLIQSAGTTPATATVVEDDPADYPLKETAAPPAKRKK